jgi:TonB family protein
MPTGFAPVAPCGSRCLSLVATACIAACVGACGSPSTPTPPPTRVLSLSGNLNFASVLVGATATATLTISNNGTGTVTVSSISLPSGGFSASWTNGQIGAGQTQSVLITFAPTAAGTFSGALSVNSDQTAGSSVLGISGTGTLPIAIYDAGSNGVSIPTLVREVKPSYTADAIANRIQGTVLLAAVVLPNGTVGEVTVLRSLDTRFGLDAQAVLAATQWLFNPGMKDGLPVAVRVTIEMSFTLR